MILAVTSFWAAGVHFRILQVKGPRRLHSLLVQGAPSYGHILFVQSLSRSHVDGCRNAAGPSGDSLVGKQGTQVHQDAAT